MSRSSPASASRCTHTRPPIRSRASSTVTVQPRASSSRAATRPLSPAPTTTTRVKSPRRRTSRPPSGAPGCAGDRARAAGRRGPRPPRPRNSSTLPSQARPSAAITRSGSSSSSPTIAYITSANHSVLRPFRRGSSTSAQASTAISDRSYSRSKSPWRITVEQPLEAPRERHAVDQALAVDDLELLELEHRRLLGALAEPPERPGRSRHPGALVHARGPERRPPPLALRREPLAAGRVEAQEGELGGQ